MQFSKMHGLGNDFMIVDAVTQNVYLPPEIIRRLSDRHYGVGFDQLLIVEPPYNPELDFHYRIFNADGSEVFQCGNGARCFAHFVRMKNLTNKQNILISTQNSQIILRFTKDNMVSVGMGEPNFNLYQISSIFNRDKKIHILYVEEQIVFCGIVSIGNPHCVIIVDNVDNAPVLTLGALLESHKYFPEKANINFMQVLNREHIRLRVYERCTGETKACGSGACAAVAVGILQGLLAEQVQVDLLGGKLTINWQGPGYSLYMTGPATHIYDGFIDI